MKFKHLALLTTILLGMGLNQSFTLAQVQKPILTTDTFYDPPRGGGCGGRDPQRPVSQPPTSLRCGGGGTR